MRTDGHPLPPFLIRRLRLFVVSSSTPGKAEYGTMLIVGNLPKLPTSRTDRELAKVYEASTESTHEKSRRCYSILSWIPLRTSSRTWPRCRRLDDSTCTGRVER